MYFDSVQAALAMDGHGPYVWGAYAISLVVLGVMLSLPGRRERRFLRELQGEQRRNTPRDAAGLEGS